MNIKTLFYATLTLIFFAVSCDKLHFDNDKKGRHGKDELKQIVIDTTLFSNTTYSVDLSQYVDADDTLFIKTQATDYAISQLSTDANGHIIYTFKANATIGDLKTGTSASGSKQQVVLYVNEKEKNTKCNKGIETEYILTLNITIQ